jgi:hypothetical protein
MEQLQPALELAGRIQQWMAQHAAAKQQADAAAAAEQ